MRVTNERVVTGPTRSRQAGGARRGADFRAFVSDEPATAPAATAQTQATAALDVLLATQQADPDAAGRARAAGRGRALLDHLDTIRLGLLAGAIPRDRLMGLAAMVREQRAAAPEPKLAALLSEIELRAHVELAKLGISVPARG